MARKGKGQAEAVASLLQNLPQGSHLTAPEVHRLAQEAGLQISLSSIYRTLYLLKSKGAVGALAGDHGVRYEAAHLDHDHLICMVCGLTIEFEDPLINGLGHDLARRKGYDYKRSRFDIYGLCPTCQSKSSRHYRLVSHSISQLKEFADDLPALKAAVESAVSYLDSQKPEKGYAALEELVARLRAAHTELAQCLVELKVEEEGAPGDEALELVE
jgi:Fur family transcriptional regulator, ferric uptake regulator